jgi:hypothetical protein
MVIGLLLAGLVGCADNYKNSSKRIPPLAADKGRIFCYRQGKYSGSMIACDVMLNGKYIGRCRSGKYFYADVTPGPCKVECTTERTRAVDFTIAPGEIRYVRTKIEFGWLVPQFQPLLEDEKVAMNILKNCSYNGEPLAEGK